MTATRYKEISSGTRLWKGEQGGKNMRKQNKNIVAVGIAGALTAALLAGCATRVAPEETVSEAADTADDEFDLPGDDSGMYESDVKPAEPAETDDALGDSWDSYTVQINDTVITLPCTAADLEAAGVEIDREYTPEDYTVDAGGYDSAWFKDAGGDSIMAGMVNTGAETAAVKDCQVTSISVDARSLTNGSLKVIFPGGIQIGSTEADLLAAYGEPDDSYEDEEYGNSYFWYGDEEFISSCNASTTADAGLIGTISITCER